MDEMEEDREALFNRLIEEKATCMEFAWNGFIRIYEKEEGAKECECKACKDLKQDDHV